MQLSATIRRLNEQHQAETQRLEKRIREMEDELFRLNNPRLAAVIDQNRRNPDKAWACRMLGIEPITEGEA